MNKEEIKKLDQEKIVGTYSRYDMVADHGKGARCVSVDGKEYIDFTAGIGVNCLGFCDDGWVEAVTAQLKKLQHVSNLFYSEPQVKAAVEKRDLNEIHTMDDAVWSILKE